VVLVADALVHVAVVVLGCSEPGAYGPTFRIISVLHPIVPAVGMLPSLAVPVQMSVDFVPITIASGIRWRRCGPDRRHGIWTGRLTHVDSRST